MKEKSRELNRNQIASRGKIFVSAILDFVLQMVLLMVLYGAVASPIITYGGMLDPYKAAKANFFSYVKDTHLYLFDDEGEAINSDLSGADYVKTMVRTWYFLNPGTTFKEKVNGNVEQRPIREEETLYHRDAAGVLVNDNLGRYYFEYRPASDLPNRENNADVYYREYWNLKDNETRLYFNYDAFDDWHADAYVEGKSLLNDETAAVLHPFLFLEEKSDAAEKAFKKLIALYDGAIDRSFKELQEGSPSFQVVYQNLLKEENSVYGVQIVGLVLSYVVSFTLYFVLLPLILKENRTVGLRANRLLYTTSKNYPPKAGNIIAKDCLLFLTEAVSLIFPVLFLGSSTLLTASFGAGFRFAYLLGFFGVLSLASIIMAAWGKKHQFLGEYTGDLVVKDTDSLMVSEEHQVIG